MAQKQSSRTRVLNAEVPDHVYWHIRKCATESRLSVKDFMAEFCQSATPLQRTTSSATQTGPVPAFTPSEDS